VTVTRTGEDKVTEMGRKHMVPYGLYRAEGYVSAKLANDTSKGTGFSEDDVALLWEALLNMFEHDHSAARGKMATRKLIVFKHDSELGNAPSHKLFDLVKVEKLNPGKPPRAFSDYSIVIDKEAAPQGVTVIEKM
jgi:CRISPR-associated protein Csd2